MTSPVHPDTVEGTHVAGPAQPEDMDPFFAGDTNVLKTYKFKYDEIVDFEREIAFQEIIKNAVSPFIVLVFPCILWSLGEYFCYEKENIDEHTRAQHLAITRDGVRYVVDQHMTGCRMFRDVVQGKVSKTVPYDKMTDCDIEDPAGASMVCGCFCPVEHVLHIVQVDTASGAGKTEGGHELSLKGLENPEQFKLDVWAMKRGEAVDGVSGTVAPLAVSMARDGAPRAMQGDTGATAQLAATMKELLEVSKQQLACLLEMSGKDGYSSVRA